MQNLQSQVKGEKNNLIQSLINLSKTTAINWWIVGKQQFFCNVVTVF